MKQTLRALVLAVICMGLNQATPAAVAGAAAPRNSLSTRPRALPDSQIEHNIRARLARSKMKEHFTVSVRDGVATLEGKTSVIQHKGVATRLARLGGAAAVENHIQISEEAKAKAAARLARYRSGVAGAEPGVIPRATVLSPKH